MITGLLTDDPTTMTECFSDSVSSAYVTVLSATSFPHQTGEGTFDERDECGLKSLDASSSMGDDGTHPEILKALSTELYRPLSFLFNSYFQSGELPREWLRSMVIPNYKKSLKLGSLNYRPTSLTSVVCKHLRDLLLGKLTCT